MSTSIQFTDSIGAATLTNGKPVPGDRFRNWTLDSIPYGESASRQSDGAISMFKYRDDYSASLELTGIPQVRVGGVAPVDIADRLKYHLLNGGTCQVNTGDVVSSVYPTCGLYPGTKPELVLSDVENIEYTFRVKLLNLAAVPVRMVCYYAEQ